MSELNVFKLERGPLSSDLYSTTQAIAEFGEPNEDDRLSKVEPQLVYFDAPFKLRLYARNTPANVTRIRCHAKIADYAHAALSRVREVYGDERIVRLGLDVYGGCYNPRKVRGGESWSKHAFAIAFDFLQAENGLNTPFAKATFGRPEYKDYLDIWQECGFANLGRIPTFNRDAMHFEFMRREA